MTQTATLRGALTMSNAASQLAALQWPAGNALVVDLAQIEAVDSSAVSVLLHWQREAVRRKVALQLINLPQPLQELIKLYDVQALLPVSSSGAAVASK